MCCSFCKEDKNYLMKSEVDNSHICKDCARICKSLVNSKFNKSSKVISFPNWNKFA